MQTLILVGGEATRLRPLTCNMPKAMVPVLNTPFLEHAICYLGRHGIKDIVLAQGYLPQPMVDYFKDGSRFGAKLTYVVENKPMGTAGAVKNASEHMEGPFFVFNGDIFTDIDITSMLKFHRDNKAKITIALVPVEDPTPFGVVETDDSGRILNFKEKPKREEITTNMINAGIYIIEPDVMDRIPAGTFYSFERQVFPDMLKEGERLFAYKSHDYWIDIGTPDKYLQVHADLLNGKSRGCAVPAGDGPVTGKNCRIDPSARIEGRVLIGDNCVIESGAVVVGPTVLGQNNVIKEKAEIRESITWENVTVSSGAVLNRCLVAKGCTMGNNVSLNEAVIGDNIRVTDKTFLGTGSKLWP